MDNNDYSTKYLTASEILARRKCDLSLVIPLAGNDTGDLNVYDGEDTGGELKLRVRLPAKQSKPFHFPRPMRFKVGLYVDFTQKIDGCLVQWKTLPD